MRLRRGDLEVRVREWTSVVPALVFDERRIDQNDGEKLCSELVDVRDIELGSSDLNLRVFDECR